MAKETHDRGEGDEPADRGVGDQPSETPGQPTDVPPDGQEASPERLEDVHAANGKGTRMAAARTHLEQALQNCRSEEGAFHLRAALQHLYGEDR